MKNEVLTLGDYVIGRDTRAFVDGELDDMLEGLKDEKLGECMLGLDVSEFERSINNPPADCIYRKFTLGTKGEEP